MALSKCRAYVVVSRSPASTHLNRITWKIFQDQWKRGQPVMVSNSHEHLNMAQWTPESFSKDYGNDKIDSIDCLNGAHLSNEPMKFFWDGFNHIDKRMQDNEGKPMLLKLKDWPPAEDFLTNCLYALRISWIHCRCPTTHNVVAISIWPSTWQRDLIRPRILSEHHFFHYQKVLWQKISVST